MLALAALVMVVTMFTDGSDDGDAAVAAVKARENACGDPLSNVLDFSGAYVKGKNQDGETVVAIPFKDRAPGDQSESAVAVQHTGDDGWVISGAMDDPFNSACGGGEKEFKYAQAHSG
ncbi:hypothetical protein ABZV61_11550 [Streptomyces sp900116325]|uniref:Secreted protein n=1 Tax=Streptomyces sp. 900116325 TaxID=3154295 RepID=A0ABV2U6G1_9ACTN